MKPLTTASYVSQQRVPAGKGLYSEFDGKPVNPTLSSYQERQYQVQGTRQAVIAPEPLAVLRQGKVMRVLIAPYTDDNDALNLPGYVYVNVKPQTWVAGDSALKIRRELSHWKFRNALVTTCSSSNVVLKA
ncbi:TraV family lipoprotein [Klebsiella pneumoniae]|uniref:TraV family lipoprotein n=1 Tax=Klebsiella pneumoniae TaxID=573 RepID=UPI002DD437C1|nr:TraV family lipoprotein [Klebsiella pneumoniae]